MPEKSVPVPKITPTNQLQKFIVINSRKYTKHPQTLKITCWTQTLAKHSSYSVNRWNASLRYGDARVACIMRKRRRTNRIDIVQYLLWLHRLLRYWIHFCTSSCIVNKKDRARFWFATLNSSSFTNSLVFQSKALHWSREKKKIKGKRALGNMHDNKILMG